MPGSTLAKSLDVPGTQPEQIGLVCEPVIENPSRLDIVETLVVRREVGDDGDLPILQDRHIVPIAVVQGPEVLALRCRKRHVPRDNGFSFRLRHAAGGLDLAGEICEGFVHLRTHGCRKQAAEEQESHDACLHSIDTGCLHVVVSVPTALFTIFSTVTTSARLASDTRSPMITRDYGGEIWNEVRKGLWERFAVRAHQHIGDAYGSSTELWM